MSVRNRRFGLFKTRAAKKELAGRDDARNQNDPHHEDSQFESQSEEGDLTVEEPRAATDADNAAPEAVAKPRWPWQKQAMAKNKSQDNRHAASELSPNAAAFHDDRASFDDRKSDDDDKQKKARQRRGVPLFGVCCIVMWLIISFAFAAFHYFRNFQYYEVFEPNVCNFILRNNPCGPSVPVNSLSQFGTPILSEKSVLEDWVSRVHRDFILRNKFRALDVNYSNTSDSDLITGNNLLGLYEREVMERPVEAGVHYLLAGSNGDYDARELFRGLALNESQRDEAQESFERIHKLNGGDGYFRLGQMYLANDALRLSNNPNFDLYPSKEPPYSYHYTLPELPEQKFPVDFLGRIPDYANAYNNMHIAVLCGVTDAIDWRRYIETAGNLGGRTEALRRQAASELDEAGKNTEGGIEAYCEGRNLRERIELLVDPAVIWRFGSDRRPWPSFKQLGDKLQLPEYEFRQWIGLLVAEAVDLYGYDENASYPRAQGSRNRNYYPYDSQGSEYYRNSPGADSTSPGGAGGNPPNRAAGRGGVDTRARDGLPAECVGMAPGEECVDRFDELECRNHAAAVLNLGKAHLAAGNVRDARKNLQLANDEGRKCQAEAARQAARLLQALNLTCEYNANSLARISRDARDNPDGGAVIGLYARQSALRAHGHYDGNIDGKYGPMTREAVRRFQGDYGFDQTGDLTPIETVYLICGAAEIKSDVRSMTTLGVMYITGLGVVQNTDAGLNWLKRADARGDVNAKYNLALIYGTGTVASSYKLCGVPENMQIADSWLEDAANRGHPKAQMLIRKYGALVVSERWEKIKTELELDEFHRNRMSAVGEGCRPN